MKNEASDRIRRCARHKVRYNAETGGCALCEFDGRTAVLGAPERRGRGALMSFTCPFCGSRTLYEKSCSRYACRSRAGLQASGLPKPVRNACVVCGSRTKYATYCTKLECRRIGGRVNMYKRRAA